jgi:spore coat protein U-like protein
MRRYLQLSAGVALLALVLPSLATAQPTTQIQVQAEITSGCVMTGSLFDFGPVSPLSITTTELSAQNESLVITCTTVPSLASFIQIDDGANAALLQSFALPGHRALTNGTSALGYDVYQPTSLTAISNGPRLWFTSSCVTPATLWELGVHAFNPAAAAKGLAAIPNENVFKICGIIPAQISTLVPLTPGVYTDTLTVTMNF